MDSSQIHSSQEEVSAFLVDLREVLCDARFNAYTDLDIINRKKGESPDDMYTTQNTMADLGYDRFDVVDRLLELKATDYSETVLDINNSDGSPFFVFGKIIGREVYIKVKIRDKERCKVFCISFHYARYPINKPYA